MTLFRLLPPRAIAFAVLLSLFVASTAAFEGGDHIAVDIHADASNTTPTDPDSVVWSRVIEHLGATYIAVRFAEFDLAPGELLFISNDSANDGYFLEGRGKGQAGEFWARHIKGDRMRLELVSPTGRLTGSLRIDEYVAGFVRVDAPIGPEAICGADDKLNAVCYRDSHGDHYEHGRAVARLLINGSTFCTGWLASADGLLMTNEHCISSNSAALNTDYEFMAEAPNCGDPNCQPCHPGTVVSGATLVSVDANLDYALVQFEDEGPSQTYGYLKLADEAAKVGDAIYIPQHPGGRAKEFAIVSTDVHDPGGVPRVTSVTEPSCVPGGGYNDVGYYADTEGGSSGSPVLSADSHEVIALHHCANCPNRGVPIKLVEREVGHLLFPPSSGTIQLDRDVYRCAGEVKIELRDGDLADDGSTTVTIMCGSGDSTTATLSEIEAGAAIFRGVVTLGGTLQVVDGDLLTAFYFDEDNGDGISDTIESTATVDCRPPAIVEWNVLEATGENVTIAVRVDEPSTVDATLGTTCGEAFSFASSAVGTTHVLNLIPTAPCAEQRLDFTLSDAAGNIAFDDNGGACYVVVTSWTVADMDQGFEFGAPDWSHEAAQGTDQWMVAPDGDARSPVNVYRFTPAASTVIDAFLMTPVFEAADELSFWHYYGLERGYDGGVIEITTDSAQTWVDLGDYIVEGGYTRAISTSYSSPIGGRRAWSGSLAPPMSRVRVDLSSFSGPVRVRFRFGADIGIDSPGWWIDDVRVVRHGLCDLVARRLVERMIGYRAPDASEDAVIDCNNDGRIDIADLICHQISSSP